MNTTAAPVNNHLAELRRTVLVILSGFLMALNINTFVHTGGLFPGGVTGLTVLIQRIFEKYMNIQVPFTLVNLILNSIPVYIGFRFIGMKFTLYSLLMILVTNISTDLLPHYVITYDVLLIAIFGGLINGFAISLALLQNATSGGTDFISIYLSERKGMDTFNIILAYNVVLLTIAGLIFGWDKALYSIIFQYASTQVIHILYKRYQQKTLLIVTEKPDQICRVIYDICRHGATILQGEGSYRHEQRTVVYSVISSADSMHVVKAVREADPKAFIDILQTQQLSGHFYYKPQD